MNLRISSAFLAVAFMLAGFLFATATRAQTETVLHSFTGAPDGSGPEGGLVMDSSGNLYGTTGDGGSSTACLYGCGTVFELANSSGSYTEKVIHSFQGAISDGASPRSGLIMDSSGNLYGTTYLGGNITPYCAAGCGTVFELVNSSGSYTEKILYAFEGGTSDGYYAQGVLAMDSSGNLYGTTFYGGSSSACTGGCGTVFELVNSSGSYVEKVLYSFQGGTSDGANPPSGVILDSSGNLYGSTETGGGTASANGSFGYGTIFELVNSPSGYTEKLLHSFSGPTGDGSDPRSGLKLDGLGNIYGTTQGGGAYGFGTIFELVNSSGSYSEKVLYSFQPRATFDGENPEYGALVINSLGYLIGTTLDGGLAGFGQVYDLSGVGQPGQTLGGLYSFTGVNGDGRNPYAGVILDGFGNLYGTTGLGGASAAGGTGGDGTVYKFTPALELGPSPLAFSGPVGATTAAQSLTLTNTTNAAFTPLSISITGANAADFAMPSTGTTCSTTAPVAAGGSCTIAVSFTPSASGGESAAMKVEAGGYQQGATLVGTGQDFAMSAADPTIAVTAGNTGSDTLQLNPEGGFSGTVTLSCSGAPAKSTCSLSPSSVTLDGTNPSSASLSITTTAASAAPLAPGEPNDPPAALWLGLLALLASIVLLATMRQAGRQTRRVHRLAPFGVLVLGLMMCVSCGGGSTSSSNTPPPPNSGTPAGNYTLTVTATSGGLTHSTKVSLTVQ